MNRIPVDRIPQLPESLNPYTAGSALYDSSCSREARVWFSDFEGGIYIKTAPAGTLKTEADMNAFFHSRQMGAEVLSYLSGDADWMVTRALAGEDCIHPKYLEDPKRLSETLGTLLRQLHETDPSGCPVPNRNETYIATVIRNHDGCTAPNTEQAWDIARQNLNCLDSGVLLHGDYCLPNVMLDNWRFSGFIDVGFGGIGDRHIDLYWGCWSLLFNLKDSRWCSRFLDAYGRRDVDLKKLRIIDAFEAFG